MENNKNLKSVNNSIINEIIQIKETLPKKQLQLCNYIIENYKHIGPLTVKELADKAEVGTTTVMRTIEALNFDSYSSFRKELHESSVQSELSTWWHLQKSFTGGDHVTNKTASQVWDEIIDILGKTLNESFLQSFDKAVDLMFHADKINILGLRSSKVAANYLGYLLGEFSSKVRQLSNDPDFLYDQMLHIKKGEVLFVFAHSPHSVQTIEAAQFCHKRGATIILITDLLSCPITPFASVVLKIEASQKQYSIVPTITLVESIVIEYGRKTFDYSVDNLEELGEILTKKNITSSNSSHSHTSTKELIKKFTE